MMTTIHAIIVITIAIVLATWIIGLLRGKGIMP